MGLTFATPNGGASKMNNRGGGHPSAGGYSRYKATPKAKKKAKPAQAQGSPHERNRDPVRPATPIKSTAVAKPLASSKVVNTPKVVGRASNIQSEKNQANKQGRDAHKVGGGNYGDKSKTTQSAEPIRKATASVTAIKPEEKGFFSSLNEAATLLISDPRTEESGRYNQKYWAERLAQGKADGNENIQSELKAEQDKLGGSSKSYNQEKVPGYFEPLDHPSQKKVATLPEGVASNSGADLKSVNDQIKNETDPVKLKALHQRRLSLMRMNNTNTKFAGLLDDANTKRTNLMSIA